MGGVFSGLEKCPPLLENTSGKGEKRPEIDESRVGGHVILRRIEQRAVQPNSLASSHLITGDVAAMPRNRSIDEILADSERIAHVWRENPTFTLGEITLPKLEEMIEDLRASRTQVEDTRSELTRMINETNSKAAEIGKAAIRARSGFRAVFGLDSSQYEQAGGTRASERKRAPSRKKTPDQ